MSADERLSPDENARRPRGDGGGGAALAAGFSGETLTLTLSDAVDRALSDGTAAKLAALQIDQTRNGAARETP